MRNIYFKSKSKLGFFVLLAAMLLGSSYADAQVRVNFTQRTSQYTPTKKIYNVKGDFTMIGNSNMTLESYSDNGTNSNNQMVYSDVDGDSSTLNSSSATLTLSTENGAVPACSNIIYAGLYWSGRSHNGDSPNTFSVTKNNVTKNYDKHVVSFKGPGASSYTSITAANSDIYYPTTTDGSMYSAYAEVTDYVKNHGIGSYTVADMALREGDGGSTGYYGGWSLIVVYENSKMKYRDVTVFDGHAYVAGSITADFEIPVSGFNTVQAGPVNMKLGLMAGEGDRSISGDYFQIRNAANTNWVTLSHSGNSTDNFFNSSIVTGGNTRNPNLTNNTGLDISMFNIANNNNSVIGNSQTSTRFRYGTTQDTYVIFAVAMAVDAYIPDVEATISALTVAGQPAQTPLQPVLPGQEMEYKVLVKNKGTEAVNNFKIVIPVPYNATYVPNSAQKTVFVGSPSPNTLTFDPTVGSNGSLVWDYGTLPLPADPETLIAQLTFKFKATTDCTLLKNLSCSNIVAVDGLLSGTGAITGIAFNSKNLIQGFTAAGNCPGTAISAPILININAIDYVNQNCQATPPISAFIFCSPGNNIPITSISGSFPPGTLFYNQFPVTGSTTQYTINNPFPATTGSSTYYAVPPNSVAGCYFPFTITVTTISSQPTATDVSYCQGATAVPLTATPSNPNYLLFYYASVNGTPQTSLTPSTAVAGATTYYVAEGQSAQCIGPKKPIVVTVYPQPTLNAPANATLEGCSTAAITTLAYSTTSQSITLAQFQAAGGSVPNSGSIGNFTLSYADSPVVGTCPKVVTRTFSLVGTCGTKTATQTITIQDTTAPVIAALPPLSAISCPATPQFAQATATDNCSAVTLTFVDVNTAKLCLGSYSVTRTWTATDACGNTATASQTINVNDTTPPVISQLPAPSIISCPATPQFVLATATDACGSEFTLSSNDVTTPGTCPNSYTVTRTWTATDGCGNTSSASQIINVIDNVPPVISALPAPTTMNCSAGNPVFTTPTATDGCGGNVTLTSNDVTTPGLCAGSYSVTRTWTATDVCGNIATASQTISVQDTTAPVIAALPAPSTINCPAQPQFAQATATDACGSLFTLTFHDVNTPGACAGSYSVTRTWTATDACGNTSTASQTINVQDVTPPVIDPLPAPVTLSCTTIQRSASLSFAQATATDACSAVTLTYVDTTTPGICAGAYSVTRTWTATDACGNTATASQTINVQDTSAPEIAALPAPSTIACPATPQFAQATAIDACGSTFTLTFNDVTTPGACANSYTVVRTWTATDVCGNTSTASQSITVTDTTPPVIAALPAPSTVNCPAQPQFAQATATDGCGGNVTLTFADVTTNGQCAGSYSVTRTWTATDACGNTATATQTIDVIDNTAPVIAALPAPSSIDCSSQPQFAQATATDACGSAFTLTFADVTTPGACANTYTTVRTWTATDACGNTSTASQTITVTDTVAPVIAALPAPSTINCPAQPEFAVATATDNCGSTFLTFADVTTPGACAGSYSVTRTWTATDQCGNSSNASQTINVIDNTAPVISTLPATSTISCPAQPEFAQASAVDACGSAFTLTSADVTTNGPCAGTYSVTRTWTATDACGNTSTASQTIIVTDTTAPVIDPLPSTSTVSCPATPEFAQATATDACGSAFTLTFDDVTTNGQCAGSYSVTRTWTATDACGNASTATQTINVEDTTAPVIAALPAPSTIDCPATPEFAQATAVDACGSLFTLTFADVNTPGACAGTYSVTRTWTATDACGNASTASQTINVQDVTPPTILTQASNITVECDGTGSVGAINDWLANHAGATAADTCSDVTWTNNFNALSNDCSAAVTVIFTATDACGNASTTSATFTVQDTTPPVAPQAPATASAICASDVPANITLTATDNCAGTIDALGVDVVTPGNCPNSFTIVRTWTFTDACNNSSSVSQTINVNDNVAPVAPAAPADVTVACAGEVPAMISLTAPDNCGDQITVEGVDSTVAGQCANSFVITRTWTFADACGNTSSVSQTINVNDTIPPVIATLPDASTVSCPAAPEFAQATATDNCTGDVTLTFADVTTNGQCAGSYSVTRTWTATDACGNTATASQTINVEDTTAPVIADLPAPSTIDCPAMPVFADATATDACGSAFTLTFADVNTPGACAGSYSVTRTWTATDACGNASTASQTINVQDVTAPEITTQASNITVECDGNGSTNAINDWLANHGGAVANDTCSDVTWTNDFNSLGNDCSAAVTVIFTATDACGNASTTSATFSVQDTTAPVAPTAPATANVVCAGDVPANVTLTATDNCAGEIAVQGNDAITPGACANSFTIVRTWTFTDACNNSSSVSQTINVNDTVAPVAPAAPADVTVTCASDVPAMISLTATDNCGEDITAQGVDTTVAGACPNSFVTTRIWTFTDACGNSSSVSQTITVNDTVAPTAPAAPADVTVACAGDVPAMVSLTATDNCNDQITADGIDVIIPGNCPNSFQVVRTWTFTDACGNSSSVSQNINVNDTVAPTAPAAPADVTVTCAGEVPPMVSLTATDNCGAQSITVDGVDAITPGNCPNSFTVTRTWTFTDACGNTSSAVQTITVDDNVAPTLPANVPADITTACVGEVPPMISLTATDNCGEQITVEGVDTTVQGACPNTFVTTRTWTFTDACGNASTATQTISVNDNVAPTFNEAAPADISVGCDAIPTAATLTATDNCVGNVTVTMAETTLAGACANSYILTRTWTATDACGNTATATQNINVSDITSPTFDQPIPAEITVECDAVPTPAQITATDNCGTATVSYNEVRTDGICIGTYLLTRTWIATDLCGNATSGVQLINVHDTTAPHANEAFDAVVNVTCDAIPDAPALTFSDNCSGVSAPQYNETITNQQPGSYTIIREWSVSDGCKNVATITQTVNVSITNSEIDIAKRACNEDITPYDLNLLLPEGTPAGGTWTDLDNTGGLTGSVYVADGMPLGTHVIQYSIVDPTCPRVINVNFTVDLNCPVLPCDAPIIHNAFSPNGDGLNEFFSIENLENFDCWPTNSVEIYNRWGVLVYDTKQYDNAENSFKGVSEGRVTVSKASELPTGTYFYIIEYTGTDGKAVKKDGYLYLSR